MVLPIPDLTGVIAAIDRNTNMIQNIVDELVRFNENKQAELEQQVSMIHDKLERQYRETIENLQKLVPNHGHSFPFINGPIGGGLGSPPGTASAE